MSGWPNLITESDRELKVKPSHQQEVKRWAGVTFPILSGKKVSYVSKGHCGAMANEAIVM